LKLCFRIKAQEKIKTILERVKIDWFRIHNVKFMKLEKPLGSCTPSKTQLSTSNAIKLPFSLMRIWLFMG
jgi:hypothetical protein